MKNHIKQMLRTPVQSVLIIVLVMIVTVMLSVGGNLWVASDRLAKIYEEDFITIGTVTQKPDTMLEELKWDAEKRDYLIYKNNGYNYYVTAKDLKFPEIRYLVEPEKRVYWGSYGPEYIHEAKENVYRMDDSGFVAEFTLKEDCVPDESVKILITKVLGSSKLMEGSVLWACDHYNKEPMELKAGRTYVAKISFGHPDRHGKRWEETGDEFPWREYVFLPATLTLYTPEGEKIEDPAEMQSIYEVTEGFYETKVGKRLLALAEATVSIFDSQPVVGTNSTDLIMPFYEGNAWVYEGRYPTAEEYAQGSTVCLAPRNFAENNNLTVGDKIMTRLYYTDAGNDVEKFPIVKLFTLLDLNGGIPEPFEEKAYTIVGLYDYKPLSEGIGLDELIVPLHSIRNQMENIVAYGAMSEENTSFRIENGTIADFLEISARYGTDNLIFNFYDRGYSVLVQGIQNLKNMSVALLVMGMITAVILTLQISHIYITKQKRRLAIERLLGITGKRCRHISLTGILLLLILGTIPGVTVGTVLADEISIEEEGADELAAEENTEQMTTENISTKSGEQIDMESEEFNRKYSNLRMAVDKEIDLSMQNQGSLAVSGIMGCLVILLGMMISGIKVRRVLRGEPLYLLEDSMAGRR